MNFAFVGCSLTFGEGFPEELRDQYIYDRLVSRYFDASETNFGSPGASNYKIFMRAAQALKSRKFDIVFVQWSPINRLWLSPGPETHWFVNDVKNSSFRYRDLYVSPKELLALQNLLLLFNHDYQNLLDLIDYCSFLEILAKQARSKLVFINGCILWKDDFNNPLGPDLATCLSDYSKIILDFDNRPDDEVIKYFTKLQTKFKDIDQNLWVNIFDAVVNNRIDTGPQGHHPGIKWHAWVADLIIAHVNAKEISTKNIDSDNQ